MDPVQIPVVYRIQLCLQQNIAHSGKRVWCCLNRVWRGGGGGGGGGGGVGVGGGVGGGGCC